MDEHERFVASESLAHQNNFLQAPIINLWVEKIMEVIQSNYADSLLFQMVDFLNSLVKNHRFLAKGCIVSRHMIFHLMTDITQNSYPN